MANDREASVMDLVILGMIACGPSCGYEIKNVIEHANMDKWTTISTAHIYYILKKLEKEELVTQSILQEGNRPPRKVYTLTEKGMDTLATLIKHPHFKHEVTFFNFDVVLWAMSLRNVASDEEKFVIIKERLTFLQDSVDTLIASEKKLKDDKSMRPCKVHPHPIPRGADFLFMHRRMYLEMEINWIKELLKAAETEGWEVFMVPEGLDIYDVNRYIEENLKETKV